MSQGTPEQQVVALLQRGDLRGAHQLLLALLHQRPDDAALRARTQQVEALIQQRLQNGLPVGPAAPPAPPPPAAYGAPVAQPYDQQTLAALQAQVLAEPVKYAYAYLQAGRLGESLQLLRIALAREPGNMQVRDLALYVARQIQQQQQAQTYAQGGPHGAPAPQYGPPPTPQYGPPPTPQYNPPPTPQYNPPPAPQYSPPPAPQYNPPPAAAASPAPPAPAAANPFAPPRAPQAPAAPRYPQDARVYQTGEMPAVILDANPALAAAAAMPPSTTLPPGTTTPPAAPRYPQDARVHKTGEMPSFMLDANPALAAAAAMPPRTHVPPSAPPPPRSAPAPRYPLDARASESMEMPLDEIGLTTPSVVPSAPPYAGRASSLPPPIPASIPPPAATSPSVSVPADEPRPEPNEVVRVARDLVKAAARAELDAQRVRTSAPVAVSQELAIDIDEPLEDVPVDFDESPELEDHAPPPALGQWPGPQWVDRSLPGVPSPVLRPPESIPPPMPRRSAPPPPASRPPASHRWDADSSSPEQDAFSMQDEPLSSWRAPPPVEAQAAEDPLVKEAKARAERMQAAFDRYTTRRDSVPAPSAPPSPASLPVEAPTWASQPAPSPVDYSEGLGADLLGASDAATEIASPSSLDAFEDEPLDLPEDDESLDEAYDFEPVPASIPPPVAEARENPPLDSQFTLADPGPGFVSAPPSAAVSGEAMRLEALLGQIRARRRSPSRHLVSA